MSKMKFHGFKWKLRKDLELQIIVVIGFNDTIINNSIYVDYDTF